MTHSEKMIALYTNSLSTLQLLVSSNQLNPRDSDQRRLLLLKMQRVENALVRLETQDFGLCLNCYQPIDSSRLKQLPFVELCHNCQLSAEANLLEADQ